MEDVTVNTRKAPHKAAFVREGKLLIGRQEAATLLSISQRALDYLVANKQLQTRRIGTRVLIPLTELQRFARADHPMPIAG